MTLAIITYHYVRDLSHSRYPNIKGRDASAFRMQLDYIAHHYSVVTVEQIVGALKGGKPLPDNAAWLTFDDGYIDHFALAFPLLHQRGWQGAFFPPVRAVMNRELLDVNRIHFMLAAQPAPEPIVADIRKFVDEHHKTGETRSFAEYWDELDRASRFDPPAVIFIKRMLQHALPETLRNALAQQLFERFVGVHPDAFAAELYMTPDQIRTMIRCGMYVGSHGDRHRWLNCLEPADQAEEVDNSLNFLEMLGAPTRDWVMSYPYGGYDDSLVAIVKDRGGVIGVTTNVDVARIGLDDPYLLPRLDTNDIPIGP